MTNPARLSTLPLRGRLQARAFAVTLLWATAVILTQPAQAQTFHVIHNFTGGGDGRQPYAGLVMDRAGNLYGTASNGGVTGGGVVFKMTHTNGGWLLNPLYNTFGESDSGRQLGAAVSIGPNGSLYGTTSTGGTGGTDGARFST